MKSLFFVLIFLLSWSSFANQEVNAAQAQQQKKHVDTKKAVTEAMNGASQDGPAVITLTPNKPSQITKVEQTTATTTEQDADTTKVLGSEVSKPAEIPKNKQEKAAAVAYAEQVVAQAKDALTQKQQAKAKQSRESLAVVEQLLKAYNARNIDAFVNLYDENVEFYVFPNELLFKGKEKLIARYGIMFKKLKCIQSSPIKRIVHGNIVIDHELSETCSSDPKVVDKRAEFVSSYQVENGKITKVLFFK
ncbi:nuclear transport factor 2 family protein [Pseudoalteromonas neustonica]|uniref:nuclear transport factor 2 family protein n=1 Tax=Pseudoalteromonas neustonica TaxID=1840331 RepID=UPI0007DB0DDC|nr:nuclear transport factor 2 family protein [Pseudoalteromonas neustonica]